MYYNENTIIFNNGQYLKATEAKTDLYGQTLHYGYGAFEGMRSYLTSQGAKIFKAQEHFERLKRSCDLVRIPFYYSLRELEEITYEVLNKNQLTNAYIRPLVYCDPNMSLNKPTKVNMMIGAWEWGGYLGDKMLSVCISSFQRPNPKSIKVEAKINGHYVNSILATIEAKEKGFDEGLLLDMHGHIAEAPGANFFCEKEGKLFTPSLGNILPGITRDTVFELCEKLNIQFDEKPLMPSDLKKMDAAFFCGTAAEIIGIESIDNCPFKMEWKNSVSAKIQQAYSNRVREVGAKSGLTLSAKKQ